MKKIFKCMFSLLLAALIVSNPCHAVRGKKTTAKVLASGTAIIGISAIIIYSYHKSKTEVPSKRYINNFNKKESAWIKFLSGEVLNHEEKTKYGFRYSSCEEFRQDNDNHLENYHDYIQAVFPNIDKSAYGNKDLFISGKENIWKYYLLGAGVKKNIQETMKKNYNRMLDFWKNKELKKNDHNLLRITRVLISLKLFGLEEEYKNLRGYLKNRFGNNRAFSNSVKYWESTEKILPLI